MVIPHSFRFLIIVSPLLTPNPNLVFLPFEFLGARPRRERALDSHEKSQTPKRQVKCQRKDDYQSPVGGISKY